MAFRNISSLAMLKSGAVSLEAEMQAEKAGALGRTASAMEYALERLKTHDAGTPANIPRDDLVYEASRATWIFFVQREMVGMRNHKPVIEHYGISKEVLSRVGQIKVDPKNDTPSVLKYL